MKTSKVASTARRSNSPFFLLAQPISGTVRTSCPGNSRRRPRGMHSSSSTRMRDEGLLGKLENGQGVLTAHGRKIIKNLVGAVSRFQVIDQGRDRHARSGKNRRTAKNVIRP